MPPPESSGSTEDGARAAGQGFCVLRYFDGDVERRVHVTQDEFVIGRSAQCELRLSDESVSRRHARILQRDGHWWIEDLGSKNGIKRNTIPAQLERLQHGDRIELGAVRVIVEIGNAAVSRRPNVVFEPKAERGHRTQVIDVEHLDALIAAPNEPFGRNPVAAVPADAAALRRETHVADPADLLRLFTDAAEALMASDSLDETLEHILGLVFANLPAERGVICLYDDARDHSEPVAMRTRDGSTEEPVRISQNIARDVIERHQALLVHDTALDERFGGADSVILMQIRSAMCAPLYHEGKVAGFIYVDSQSGDDPFTAAHLQTLSALALLSAVAVEKAKLRDNFRKERDIRQRLQSYSSPAVVDRIVEGSNTAQTEMAAQESELTVLFADLTGFTSMSETMGASEVVDLLNRVFERFTRVIFDSHGTLDKFRGDGLMAFWGAPLALENHAELAVEAALTMQERLSELNSFAPQRRPLAMRIGINTGPVVVGDIGTPARKDYTVIGDAVNVASRLESTVAQPGQVVIGAETYKAVRERFACRELKPVRLKGKRREVQPYLVDRFGH